MLSKTNYEMLFCAPQWGQTIPISTCHLSIDYFFLLPSNHSIFITLTALWFWDFKAEFVVGLLKQSIWKCVQPWGWVVNFLVCSHDFEDEIRQLNQEQYYVVVCRVPGVSVLSWGTSKGPSYMKM